MKNSKQTSFIIISGILVLCVFTFVATYNMMPSVRGSKSYYVKVGETMSAKIESLSVDGNKLTIETSGDAEEYCVKSTISSPQDGNLCWKKIENNTAIINIYSNKRYYIWIKDTTKNISNPMTIDSSKE